jgi:hypothetical protein
MGGDFLRKGAIMKLKLLLYYVLVACTLCFAAAAANTIDDDDDDDMPVIVSDSVEAMGGEPQKITKKIAGSDSNQNLSMTGSFDPYAKKAVPLGVDILTVDPYAKKTAPVELVEGDPYSLIGLPAVAKAIPSIPKILAKKEKTVRLGGKKRAQPIVHAQKSANSVVIKKPFVPREKLSLTSALFKSMNSGNESLAGEAKAAVEAIDNEIKARENKLKVLAEEHLDSVTREISLQAAQLREEADAVAKELKMTTEGRVQALLATAEDCITQLNVKVAQESIELKKDAAVKALSLIDAMEQRAAAQRTQERKRTLAETFGLDEGEFDQAVKIVKKDKKVSVKKQSTPVIGAIATTTSNASVFPPFKESEKQALMIENSASQDSAQGPPYEQMALRVSAEWKNDLSRRFYEDMTMMKNIIFDAESPQEAQDFLKKFEDQNKWFDLTLRSTRLVTDDQYAQLVAKQSQMDRLMQSQRAADGYFQKFTKNMVLDAVMVKKMRLACLYELNAKVQQRASHLDRAVRESSLPDEEVKQLVKRTLSDFSQQFREIAAQFPDVEIGARPQLSIAAVPLRAQQLEQELNEVKADMEASKQELASAQQQLTAIKEDFIGMQKSVEKKQQALDQEGMAKEELINKNAEIKAAALGFIDKQSLENAETELAFTGISQDSAMLKKELAGVTAKNSILIEQKKSLVGAVEVARKETINADLLAIENVNRAQQAVMVAQRQSREQIKSLKESGAKTELSLTADLRNAHQRIARLTSKQAQLVQELGKQRQVAVNLKSSLKGAQEAAGRAESLNDLAQRSLGENAAVMKHQAFLRRQAEERVKITEELAQKTIDSINGFLKTERKALAKREVVLDSQEDFLEAYREQLSKDREMLYNLKRETRKIVERKADLGDTLSDNFVQIQEQIENELRQAHQETNRELRLVENRLNYKEKSGTAGDLRSVMQSLATASAQQDNDEIVQSEEVVQLPLKAVIPGARQFASKQVISPMPGLIEKGGLRNAT